MFSIILSFLVVSQLIVLNNSLFAPCSNMNEPFHSVVKIPSFLKKHPGFKSLTDLSKARCEVPIIIEGNNDNIKEEALQIIASSQKMHFYKSPYDDFIKLVPHLKYSNTMIYVPDFLIQNGRIFNEYETEFMQRLRSNSNLIILGSQNLKNILFKDEEIYRDYHVLEFPDIRRKHIIIHIQNMIAQNGYDEYLYSLPWSDVPIENLSFELINMLIFELAMIRSEYPSASFSLETLILNIRELKSVRESLRY